MGWNDHLTIQMINLHFPLYLSKPPLLAKTTITTSCWPTWSLDQHGHLWPAMLIKGFGAMHHLFSFSISPQYTRNVATPPHDPFSSPSPSLWSTSSYWPLSFVLGGKEMGEREVAIPKLFAVWIGLIDRGILVFLVLFWGCRKFASGPEKWTEYKKYSTLFLYILL
jgi:hypothetical protein